MNTVVECRRADWMLLLPASITLPVATVVVVGGTDELADSLVRSGIAGQWVRHTEATEPAELVVAWADAGARVDQLGGLLATDGVLVMEVDRRRTGRRRSTLRSIRQQLARHGCTVYSGHVVSPSLERPRRFLPADAPAAMRWHLRTLYVPSTPLMRLARTVLATMLRTPAAGAALGLAAARLLVIAVRDSDQRALGSPPIGDPLATRRAPTIVLTSGYDPGSRAVVLPFGVNGRSPAHVIKVASSSESAESTAREHQRLTELHSRLSQPLIRSLPVPISISTIGGRTACVQSCAEGPSLNAATGRWGRPSGLKRRELARVAEWLDGLGLATRVQVRTGDANWTRVFDDACASLDLSSTVELFLRAAGRAACRSGLATTAVYQHYDSGPWNIHVRGRSSCFIDWEIDSRRPADSLGPPLADVLYLATYWYFLVCGADTPTSEERAINRLFVARSPADHNVAAVRQVIDRSLLSLDLGRPAVPAALAALWAERAIYTARRRALDSGAAGGSTRPVAYLGVLAGAGHDLFANDGWWVRSVGSGFGHAHPTRPTRSTSDRA